MHHELDNLKDLADRSVRHALDLKCQYCDVRAETVSKHGLVIEDGEIEHITEIDLRGLGIRVLFDGAWGFFSVSNPSSEDIKNAVEEAVKSAKHHSTKKKNKIEIANFSGIEDTVIFPVKNAPTADNLREIGLECDKIIHQNKKINKSVVSIGYNKTKKYFANTEGSKITQEHTDTIADLVATAHESGITQSVDITEGGRGGIELLDNSKSVFDSANFISKKACELLSAKPADDEKATVVLNPDFVALLTHEILGHPSEADRVLGKEMAWAGGVWWAGKLGQQIGSESLSVFDDPTIEQSLGWYRYDDEGIRSSKTALIENGILTHHMQSRETAKIFDDTPTANMRATSYEFMPLIRMACTCIDKGDWNPEEIIKDVKSGYYISNMKIPSIDMKRYNWSISCQFAQKIENGELTELLRDVIVLGTAPDFFQSIDACGKDFTVRPVTNCGKGDPMQSMIMGNGGPTVRASATVKSVKS